MAAGGDSILTDLTRQVGDLILSPLPSVTSIGVGAVQICGENPIRLALYVQSETGSPFVLYPYPQVGPATLTRTVVQNSPTVLHAAVYPVLIFLSWYLNAPVGEVFRVWEVSKER